MIKRTVLALCVLILLGLLWALALPKAQPPEEEGLSLIEKIDREETYPDGPFTLAVIYEDVASIVEDADVIAYVSVGEREIETPGGYPQTHTLVTVQETYKGTAAAGDSLEVVEEGGGEGKVLGGIPQLSPEYEYVLFLTEYDGCYYVCGAYQGRFILREGYLFQQATEDVKLATYEPLPLADFAAQITK